MGFRVGLLARFLVLAFPMKLSGALKTSVENQQKLTVAGTAQALTNRTCFPFNA